MDNVVVRKYKLKPSQVIAERARQLNGEAMSHHWTTTMATLEFLDVFRECLQESNREAAQVILNALESSIVRMKEAIEDERSPSLG